jgi:ribosomal protein L40E
MTEAAAPPVEAASSPHAMVCEGCGSSDVRKFSVVYEEQSSTSSSKTTLAGAGLGPSGLGVGLARGGTTGTSHTRLASRTTPPNMEKMSKEDPVTQLAIVAGMVVGAAVAYFVYPVAGFLWAGGGFVVVVVLVALFGSSQSSVGERYRKAKSEWNRKYVCMKCGATVLQPIRASARQR